MQAVADREEEWVRCSVVVTGRCVCVWGGGGGSLTLLWAGERETDCLRLCCVTDEHAVSLGGMTAGV